MEAAEMGAKDAGGKAAGETGAMEAAAAAAAATTTNAAAAQSNVAPTKEGDCSAGVPAGSPPGPAAASADNGGCVLFAGGVPAPGVVVSSDDEAVAPTDAASADNGGCMLFAINKCAGGEALTKDDLDGEIDAVCSEFNKKEEWSPDKYKREWAGTDGEAWHFNCVAKALKRKYGDGYTFHKVDDPGVVSTAVGEGKFLVWGEKNRLLWPDVDQDSNWQHAICVDTSAKPRPKFYEGDHPNGLSVEKWLNHRQADERWMSQVSRVYKLEAPGMPSGGRGKKRPREGRDCASRGKLPLRSGSTTGKPTSGG
jgi:hypothetical protein